MFMLVGSLALFATLALGVEIANIQGPAWLSPLNGQTVQNVTGMSLRRSVSTHIAILNLNFSH